MAETVTDRLVAWGLQHGWTVTDDRATHVTEWFVRGEQYALLGTDITGTRVLTAYGGVKGRPGRPGRFWSGGEHLGKRLADYLAADYHP